MDDDIPEVPQNDANILLNLLNKQIKQEPGTETMECVPVNLQTAQRPPPQLQTMILKKKRPYSFSTAKRSIQFNSMKKPNVG